MNGPLRKGAGNHADLRPATPSRVTGLDAARVFATLGIVWVHVAEIQKQPESFSTLGRFGTSFYVLAALFLSCRTYFLGRYVAPAEIVRRRARRLLVPYLIWCALYGTFYFLTMYPQGLPVEVITRYWGPLFGTSPHLWFLPFAFCAGALATYAVPWLMTWPSWLVVGVGGAVTFGAYAWVYGRGVDVAHYPLIDALRLYRLDRWVEELPLVSAAIFGLSIYGKHISKLGRLGRGVRMKIARGAWLFFIAVQYVYSRSLADLALRFSSRVRFFANVAGAAWLVAFIAARDGKWIERIAPYGRSTYFAYLCHQMLIDGSKRALSFVPGHGQLWFAILTTLIIFCLSVSLGRVVGRVRVLKWLSP